MIKLYCPICECEREITPIQKEETYPVKGGGAYYHHRHSLSLSCMR